MAKKQSLSKEQEKAVNNYKNQIKTITSFMEAVRKRATMYVGSRGPKGFLNIIREGYQNSIDQIMMKDGIATYVILSYDENSKVVMIQDDGLGLPFGEIERICTEPHTSKNFDKEEGDFSSGTYGIGLKAICALSDYLLVRSFRYTGEAREMLFNQGVPQYPEEKAIDNPDSIQGTYIEFKVDESIMGECELESSVIYNLFTIIASLSTIGTTVHFNFVTKGGQVITETFVNEEGILTELNRLVEHKLVKPIVMSEYTGVKTVDLVFTWDSSVTNGEEIVTSFANMSPTTGGTHVEGLLDGIFQFFRNYVNKIFLANVKKNKIPIINNDIKIGLRAMIHVKHIEPDLEGQSKEGLTNADVKPFVKEVVLKNLEQWSKTNPDELLKLCNRLVDIAKQRARDEKGREKIINKYSSNNILSLPPKYKKPTNPNKDLWEFIIVEGDSAGGSAINARKDFQGIMPIRGKMPNAFTTPRNKYLNNEEVKAIFAIINNGRCGDKFDINKMEYQKFIVNADADVDGLHIYTLVLGGIMLYAPQIIESGRFYRAQPPLFGINNGTEKNPKYKYYNTEQEYLKYVQGLFIKDNTITTVKNSTINAKELDYITNLNIDYTYYMDNIAKTYSLNPLLLEDIVLCSDLSFEKMYKKLHSKYKYLDIRQMNGVTVIDGLIGNKINTIYLTDKFMNDLAPIQQIVNSNDAINYKINGETKSLYEFMTSFDAYKPNGVERYKGLGEMDAYQLGDSTLDPDKRVLIRVTMEDAKEEIKRIELLKGVSATRHDL